MVFDGSERLAKRLVPLVNYCLPFPLVCLPFVNIIPHNAYVAIDARCVTASHGGKPLDFDEPKCLKDGETSVAQTARLSAREIP